MRYRALVQSDRTEDVTCESFTAACEAALDLSVEFGYVDVRRNICGPEPVMATFYNGREV